MTRLRSEEPRRHDDEQSESWFDAVFARWWGKLVVALVLGVGAVFLYGALSGWHVGQRSGPSRYKALIGILYVLGGRFGAVALLAAGAIALFVSGIRQRSLPPQDER